MTCAKQVVTARIIGRDGHTYTGTNACRRPQAVCPRGDRPSGSGYDLCRDVCEQEGHAEVMAIKAAGDQAEGGTLYLDGHRAVCPDCQRACDAAGIAQIHVLPSKELDRCLHK